MGREVRFGPYVQAGSIFASLKADDDVLTIGENRAITLIADKREKAGKEIGKHPDDGEPIFVAVGRWGPFVKHKKTIANIRDVERDDITLEMAIKAIKEKEAKSGKTTKASAKKTATKKAPAKKKTAAKKPAAKKTTKKKAAAD